MQQGNGEPPEGVLEKAEKDREVHVRVEAVKWLFAWQEEPKYCHFFADSGWGGNIKDRKSTSGGVWMLGGHCVKTRRASQGPYALSSAEAEFYTMIEAVTRAKGLWSLAVEFGFKELSNVVHLGIDSSTAKSFVCRRGLGKMRHLEIRDRWLHKEVAEGKVLVEKVLGIENPVDSVTKLLGVRDIMERLERMNMRLIRRLES